MAIGPVVSIGGQSFPIRPDTLNLLDALGQNETADFEVDDRHGILQPHLFDTLLITDGATTLFRGDINSMELRSMESPYDVNGSGVHTHSPVGARVWSIGGSGLSYRARRLVTGAFSASARIDLATVVAVLAAGLGIPTSINTSTSPLPLANSFLSEQESLADAFTRLADLATYMTGITHIWKIADVSGTIKFLFQPVTNLPSSGNLGVGGYAIRSDSIRYRTSREQFANSVILKLDRYLKDGGSKQTDNKVGSDIFLGTLKLTSPLASQPTITVNGTAETVGVKDIDTGKQWYWLLGSSVLTVGSSSASGSDTIVVDYAAHDLRAYTLTNAASVAAVGLVQVPVNAGDSGNSSSPAEQAGTELARRLGAVERVTCSSSSAMPNGVPSSALFACGQLVSIVLSGFGTTGTSSLSGTFVIQSVHTSDRGGIDYVRTFDLIRGPIPYRAASFMSRISR